MMKKWVMILLTLTILATFSVGYAETRVDSIICIVGTDLETIQKSERKVESPKAKPGTIFTVDKDLENIQRNGY